MEWVIKPLGELVTFERGLTYSKSDEAEFSSNGVLRSNNVDLETNSLNLDEIKYLKADFVIPSSKKVVRNSLLMCMSNGSKSHLGKVALIEDDLGYAFGGFMGLLKPIYTVVLPRYLYYSLISPAYKKHIQSLSDGANINNLKYKDLSVFPVMLPTSLSEQQRIVDILDAEFAKIDALKENAEKNLQNAKDLFQAVLRKELEPKEGWDKKSIDEVVSDIFSGGDAPKDNMSKEPTEKYCVPIYANAVENDGLYGYTDYSRVHQPSITVSARGSGTGHTLRRYDSYLPIVRLIVIIPNSDIVLLDYIYYSLRSVKIDISGSAIPQLTVPMLKKHEVNYPVSLKEQQRIVSVLDDLSVKCCEIENNYKRSILLCNDLKQALLRKAFNGEL